MGFFTKKTHSIDFFFKHVHDFFQKPKKVM